MIARLRGDIVAHGPDWVVIDCGGVGYRVTVGPALAAAGDGPVIVHTVQLFREDGMSLVGFAAAAERDAFEVIVAVNGVGPRIGVGLLAQVGVGGLARAVAADDIKALTKVAGVGPKLASRLCLELKGKLDVSFLADATASAAAPRPSPSDPLVLALARLDYKKSEIDRALSGGAVPGPEAPLDERLRAALRVLSPQA